MRGASATLKPWPTPLKALAAAALPVAVPAWASPVMMPRMLPPPLALVKLLPSAPTTPRFCEPAMVCHCTPNSASLLVDTSTIKLSTSTWARRPSSWSITWRSWRYSGSGAVMMSELVLGSAWIRPPVEGWLPCPRVGLAPAPRPPLLPPRVLLPIRLVLLAAAVALAPPLVGKLLVAPPPPPLPAALPPMLAMAARKVTASLAASAFFKYTTWMLPLAALLPGRGGWSSLFTRARICANRAGLAARTTMALLRGSGSSVVLYEVSLWPGALAPPPPWAMPPSTRRASNGAKSAAMAWRRGMISTSVACATSMLAMMRAMRCRLSA